MPLLLISHNLVFQFHAFTDIREFKQRLTLEVRAPQGGEAVIPCEAPESRPAALVTYLKNGVPLSSSSGKSSLLKLLSSQTPPCPFHPFNRPPPSTPFFPTTPPSALLPHHSSKKHHSYMPHLPIHPSRIPPSHHHTAAPHIPPLSHTCPTHTLIPYRGSKLKKTRPNN